MIVPVVLALSLLSPADCFAAASHAGWWTIAGLGAVVLVLGLLTTGRWARSTVERAAVPADLPATARMTR